MTEDVEVRAPPRGTRLRDDEKAIGTIVKMWNSGEQNIGKIARELGHPYRVVALEIDSLIKEGELNPKGLGGRIRDSLTDRFW